MYLITIIFKYTVTKKTNPRKKINLKTSNNKLTCYYLNAICVKILTNKRKEKNLNQFRNLLNRTE